MRTLLFVCIVALCAACSAALCGCVMPVPVGGCRAECGPRPPLAADLAGQAYGGQPRLYTEPQHPLVDETGHWRLMGDGAYRSWQQNPALPRPLPQSSPLQ